MIRVLIVEGQALVRAGLVRLLCDEKSIEIVGETGEAERACALARRLAPGVVILDLATPGLGGLELIRKLARCLPDTRVLTVGNPSDGPYPSRALESGAHGYLTRGSSRRELLDAVHRVALGHTYLSAAVAESMLLARLGRRPDPLEDLSPRELSVMVMISEARDRRAISDTLCISPKTVSTYRSRLLRKLGASSDVELTHLSLRHGLIDPWQLAAPSG